MYYCIYSLCLYVKCLLFIQTLLEEREEKKKQEALLAVELEKEVKQREFDEAKQVSNLK